MMLVESTLKEVGLTNESHSQKIKIGEKNLKNTHEAITMCVHYISIQITRKVVLSVSLEFS